MSELLYFGPTPGGREAQHPFVAAASPSFSRLRVASAFATESGVDQVGKLVGSTAFAAAEKQWLVGLENGFTQPAALRKMMALPNSTLCLVDIHEVLQSPGLAASRFFHPKVYEFAEPDSKVTTIVATSANLTEGGLRNNIEQFMSWHGSTTAEVPKTLDSWWKKLWKDEWLATDALVAEYDARRPTIQRRSGVVRSANGAPVVEVEPPATELRAATQMWVEAVRVLEGGSQNQLELMLNAHTFFFPDLDDVPRDAPRSLVFIDDAGNEYTNPDRQILYNGPPLRVKGNSMWRVYLPTAHEGLAGYQDGGVLIRFARTAERDRYRISFVPTGSVDADGWYDSSSKVASVSGPPTRLMGWST